MIKPKALSQILVSAYLVRLMITGASIGDALVIASLTGLYGYWMYLEFIREPEANQDLRDKVAKMEDKINNTEAKIGAVMLRR